MTIDQEKAALRATLRERRRALGADEVARASRALVAHLGQLFPPRAGSDLLGTRAHGGEVDPVEYLEQWCQAGGRLLLPRVTGPGQMEWRLAPSPQDCLPGFRGIPEPDPGLCPLAEPRPGALILVPALAYDPCGGRLGQGGGFYDRVLASALPGAISIGLCHDFQMVECVPRDPTHDRPVGCVITPSGLRFRAG